MSYGRGDSISPRWRLGLWTCNYFNQFSSQEELSDLPIRHGSVLGGLETLDNLERGIRATGFQDGLRSGDSRCSDVFLTTE